MTNIKLVIEDSNQNIIGRSDNLSEKSKIKISPSFYHKNKLLCLLRFSNLGNNTVFIEVIEDNNKDDRYIYISEDTTKETIDFQFENDFTVAIKNILNPSEFEKFLQNNNIEEGFLSK